MKPELRKAALKRRLELDDNYLKCSSEIICCKLKKLQKKLNLKTLGLYYPIKNEIDVKELFKENLLVYINKDNLEFSKITSDFVKNNWGIYEVKNTKSSKPSAIIVPALLYNLSGYRLGYGKGYYDRYINSHPEILTIGVILDEFLTKTHFEEAYDEKVDYIISEKRTIKIDD